MHELNHELNEPTFCGTSIFKTPLPQKQIGALVTLLKGPSRVRFAGASPLGMVVRPAVARKLGWMRPAPSFASWPASFLPSATAQ